MCLSDRHAWLALLLPAIVFMGCGAPPSVTVNTPDGSDGAHSTVSSTPSPEPFKDELVICAIEPPDSLFVDPNATAQAMLRLATIPYAVYGDDYLAEPGLLSALPSVLDGTLQPMDDGTMQVTLRYRDNLVWSDGTPFNLTDGILGLEVPGSLRSPRFEIVDTAIGNTVVFVTARSDTEYPYVPSQFPLPSHLFVGGADPLSLLPSDLLRTALGPYFLQDVGGDGSYIFAANPHYALGEISIPIVRYRFMAGTDAILAGLESGDCDAALDGTLPPDLPLNNTASNVGSGLKVYAVPGTLTEQIILNTSPDPGTGRIPYFADVRVRQAMAKAIDRSSLAEQQTQAFAAVRDSWIPVEHWAYSPVAGYSYDVAAAESLLNLAGWVRQGSQRVYAGEGGLYACQRGGWSIPTDGVPITFNPTLVYPSGDARRQQIAEQIASDLLRTGIVLQLQPVEPAVLYSQQGPLVQRAFDMALLLADDRPDPGGTSRWVGADVFRHPVELTAVHRWQLEDRWLETEQLVERLAPNNIPSPQNDFQGQNFSGWCQDSADLLIVEAVLARSVEDKQTLYAEHQAIVAAEVPVIPLYSRPRVAATAPYVCGVKLGPYDPMTWNIADWFFDESGSCVE